MEATPRPALLEKDKNVLASPHKRSSSNMMKLRTPLPPRGNARKRSLEAEGRQSPSTKRLRRSSPLSSAFMKTIDLVKADPITMDERSPSTCHAATERQQQTHETTSAPEMPQDSSQGHDSTFSSSTTLIDVVEQPSAAQTLRLRLRYAMFKVRTEQVNADISRMEVDVPPTSKAQLVIRDPPEEIMRAFNYGEVPEIWLGVEPSQRPCKGQSTNVARPLLAKPRPKQVLEPGPEILAAPAYAPWVPTSSSGPLSPTLEAEQHLGPYYYRRAIPAMEPPLHRCDTSSPERIEYGSCWGRSVVHGTERDLTSSAVKDKAADSLLRLGGRL